MANELVIKRSIDIKAPASKVWETLTDPEHTKKYMFGCEVISDWKIGSPIEWKGASDGVVYVKGKLLALDEEKLFKFTVFDPNSGIDDVPSNYTTVSMVLTPGDGLTTLSVMQGDFSGMINGESRFIDAETGWDLALPKLKEAAEK